VTLGVVAPWFTERHSAAAPAGVDPTALALAMFEDLYDALSGLELMEACALVAPGLRADVEPLLWPGAQVHEAAPPDAGTALATLAAGRAGAALVVAADAPDLPPLLIGKAMRALGRAEAAYCESATGGLVFLAARCPVPSWVVAARPDLDDAHSVQRLRATAPRRTAVAATPGWHRLRRPGDISVLDPGLEGWDATRSLLAGHVLPGRG
jgi:hypothetical protein